jgi:multiple sugar transport system substrate-binding protein
MLGAAVPTGVFLAACGASGDAGTAATQSKPLGGTIRFSHLSTKSHVDAFAAAATRFQALHPGVTVSAEPTWKWDNAKFIAEAVGGDTSDVVWTSENFVTPLYAKSVVAELDGYLSKDKSLKTADYFDSVLNAYKFRGKQVGLPILWGAYVMYYNKSLFERFGRKLPDDSWTWETFLDTARALSRPSNDPAVFGQYGFETRWHENVWAPWVWNNGGDIFTPDGLKMALDKPEAIEGLQYYIDLIHRHRIAPTSDDLSNHKLGTNAFGTGQVGMVWNAIYTLPTYRNSDALQQMEWDVAPIPKGKKGRTTTNPTSGLAMWKGSKNPDTAYAFMRHLISEESSRSYVAGAVDGLPVHRAAAEDVLKDSRPPKSKQVYIDAFKYAKPAFTTAYGQRAILQLNEDFKSVFKSGGSVRDFMTSTIGKLNLVMQEEINADTKKS